MKIASASWTPGLDLAFFGGHGHRPENAGSLVPMPLSLAAVAAWALASFSHTNFGVSSSTRSLNVSVRSRPSAPLKHMRTKDVKALFSKSVDIDLKRKSPRKK